MGYIVPFLTISSILIDVCFTNVIFIGAIFNSYNYWYLLSYSNQLTLHYSILARIIKKNLEKNSKKGIKDNIIRNNSYNIIDDKNIKHWKLTKLY